MSARTAKTNGCKSLTRARVEAASSDKRFREICVGGPSASMCHCRSTASPENVEAFSALKNFTEMLNSKVLRLVHRFLVILFGTVEPDQHFSKPF